MTILNTTPSNAQSLTHDSMLTEKLLYLQNYIEPDAPEGPKRVTTIGWKVRNQDGKQTAAFLEIPRDLYLAISSAVMKEYPERVQFKDDSIVLPLFEELPTVPVTLNQ